MIEVLLRTVPLASFHLFSLAVSAGRVCLRGDGAVVRRALAPGPRTDGAGHRPRLGPATEGHQPYFGTGKQEELTHSAFAHRGGAQRDRRRGQGFRRGVTRRKQRDSGADRHS